MRPDPVLAVTCPICDAAPGEPCIEWGADVGRFRDGPHVFRVHAAETFHALLAAAGRDSAVMLKTA